MSKHDKEKLGLPFMGSLGSCVIDRNGRVILKVGNPHGDHELVDFVDEACNTYHESRELVERLLKLIKDEMIEDSGLIMEEAATFLEKTK